MLSGIFMNYYEAVHDKTRFVPPDHLVSLRLNVD